MKKWFSINLGDALLADEQLTELKQQFISQFVADGNPEGMAMFMRHESEGRLHCEVKLYFSPASRIAAKKLGARLCDQPSPDGLALLAGHAHVWSQLFPDHKHYNY